MRQSSFCVCQCKYKHNPAMLNYRVLHLFHSGIDSIKVLTAVFGLQCSMGGLEIALLSASL